jgi:hypothetical protein
MIATTTAELIKSAADARSVAESVYRELAPVTTLAAIATADPRELRERCDRALRIARRLVRDLEHAIGE